MILGAHVSIAGGLQNAPRNGKSLGCESIQIFTRNQRQWKVKSLETHEIQSFRNEMDVSNIQIATAHASYLINLGSPEESILIRSREAFCQEFRRCEELGITYLIVHPGAHVGSGEKSGLKTIAESLNFILEREQDYQTQILLETTAGQGSQLGHRFEHLAEILLQLKEPNQVGICIDTCHIFAAGYDFRTRQGFFHTLEELEKVIGLAKVKAFHLNDSKRELGSRVDRHDHIGEGCIGLEAFRLLVNEKCFDELPMILETPGGEEHYRDNLENIRNLIK